ncbi:helix-turn-helix domain-containing protein [Spirillospora sp. CA-128828]|uniref:helix-turn-helix domain-containing protein n=1 Tax=Spirillospora sp. CA-128828 TaxID=3240033 RepID=UPI003D8A68BE
MTLEVLAESGQRLVSGVDGRVHDQFELSVRFLSVTAPNLPVIGLSSGRARSPAKETPRVRLESRSAFEPWRLSVPRRPRDPGVPSSPTEYFGTELRAYREASGLSRPQFAERLGFTPQWIGQIESGSSTPSDDFARACDTFFGTNGSFCRIWAWIQDFGRLAVLPPGFPDFIAREREATGMHIFENMVITGLFQTPEYAYEVIKSDKTSATVEQLVATRMERRLILGREARPNIVALFDEGAIRRPVGSPEVMKAQLEHLIGLADEHNITLQIVPGSKGAYAGLLGAFTIMSFLDEPDAVHVEGHIGAQLVDHPDAVRKFGVRFDLIRGAAMSADDSVDMLRTILEKL